MREERILKHSAPKQGGQLRSAGTVCSGGQQNRPQMQCLCSPPMRRYQILTWSPHAGVNHAARQPGLGNNCVISPPSVGASPPGRKSPQEETTRPVRPLRKGKYPSPQRPSRPQIMSVFEGRGLVGWKAGRLEELTLAGATPGGVYTVLLPPQHGE